MRIKEAETNKNFKLTFDLSGRLMRHVEQKCFGSKPSLSANSMIVLYLSSREAEMIPGSPLHVLMRLYHSPDVPARNVNVDTDPTNGWMCTSHA